MMDRITVLLIAAAADLRGQGRKIRIGHDDPVKTFFRIGHAGRDFVGPNQFEKQGQRQAGWSEQPGGLTEG